MANLILIRGLPGSGKSIFAKKVCRDLWKYKHVEADFYFECSDGYKFDASKLKDAHEWCQAVCDSYLSEGKNVVVSNTFTQKWEIEPYKKMAEDAGAELLVLKANGEWPSVHNVPEDKIKAMKERWEDWPEELDLPQLLEKQ